MNASPQLRIGLCSAADARRAVMAWHYSRSMPLGLCVRHGVWEGDRFVGVIIYARGACSHLGSPYGCAGHEACELTRVALAVGRKIPTSRVLAVSLKLLKRANPGLRVVVSYADPRQGHTGRLYQACNWIHDGLSTPDVQYFVAGRWTHSRAVNSGTFGSKGGALKSKKQLPSRPVPRKFRYVYLFDKTIKVNAKPYPKKLRAESIDSDATGSQPVEGGATPTAALQSSG